MMLPILQYILPAVCLAYLFVFLGLVKRNATGFSYLVLLAVAAAYFMVDSVLMTGDGTPTMKLVALAIANLLPPVMCYMVNAAKQNKLLLDIFNIVGIVFPVIVFAVLLIVILLEPGSASTVPSSTSETVRLVVSVILAIESVTAIALLVKASMECDKDKKTISYLFISIVILSCLRLIPLGWIYFYALNVVTSVVVLLTGTRIAKLLFNAVSASRASEEQTKHAVVVEQEQKDSEETPSPKEKLKEDKSQKTYYEVSDQDIESEEEDELIADQDVENDDEEEEEEGETSQRTSTTTLSEEVENTLRAKFENYLIEQQKFLTPGLTIADLARDIQTNRTYISQLVNKTYGMTFPEFLNNLRIDYAEQFILHNRNASQQEIAHACGFPSASSFNVTFKKITGVTPRIWLVTHDKNQG